jgi:hypothetical protein
MNKDKGRQQSSNERCSIRVVIPVYEVQNSTIFRKGEPKIQFRQVL